ncbi:unnamed protein product [Echinostoma caproni]|uniref:Secreted protein n=1 Tax=Echinostoma caproni TaxID=27848 RepID=A0A183BGK0_9TREM|nr:unnamed protein product [Echinostoma caproni]
MVALTPFLFTTVTSSKEILSASGNFTSGAEVCPVPVCGVPPTGLSGSSAGVIDFGGVPGPAAFPLAACVGILAHTAHPFQAFVLSVEAVGLDIEFAALTVISCTTTVTADALAYAD